MTSEGPKLNLRSNTGFKKEENALLCLHNASLEGPELFGPPKIVVCIVGYQNKESQSVSNFGMKEWYLICEQLILSIERD